MRPPCETMVVKLLPAFRALVSHYLIQDYKFTQNQVAQAMGVTQASISRGISQLDRFQQQYTPSVHRSAKNFAQQLSEGNLSIEEGITALCKFCTTQKIGGTLCQLHRMENPDLKDCMICSEEFTPDDRIEVLNNLSRSAELLANSEEFTPLIPQVRSQLVMSVPNPQDLDDVAGFPSRIVPHHMKPYSFTRPEFRGSFHLSRVLLLVQSFVPKMHAAIVFKYLEGLESILRALEITFTEVTRQPIDKQRTTDEALLAGIENVMKKKDAVEVLIDKGLVGIEPVVYLFAVNAEEAVKKAVEIAHHIN